MGYSWLNVGYQMGYDVKLIVVQFVYLSFRVVFQLKQKKWGLKELISWYAF